MSDYICSNKLIENIFNLFNNNNVCLLLVKINSFLVFN